mgnify:CR=1 FL=1|tara:strand:- start:77 stop:331 length:255 start_codon:yes stop_codon:yes gene_type:complete
MAKLTKINDQVANPAHYTQGDIECLTYIEDSLGDGFVYFLEGNIKKYLHRYRHKHDCKEGKLRDLKKAQFYLQELCDQIAFKVD